MNSDSNTIKFNTPSNDYYKGDNHSRPTGSVTGRKSFKNVLDKEDGNGQGQSKDNKIKDGESAVEDQTIAFEEQTSPQPLLSPFDLSKKNLKTTTKGQTLTGESGIKQPNPLKKDPSFISSGSADDSSEATGVFSDEAVETPVNLYSKLGKEPQEKTAVATPSSTHQEGEVLQPHSTVKAEPNVTIKGDTTDLVVENVIKPDELPLSAPLKSAEKATSKFVNSADILAANQTEKPPIQQRGELVVDAAAGEAAATSRLSGSGASKQEHSNEQFTREQSDLSYVNPIAAATAQQQPTAVSEATVERVRPVNADLKLLIDQLAKEITVIKTGDKNETIIELKTPLFDGVRLTVTSDDTARNQFNIKFENLTTIGQKILLENQATLRETLAKDGHNIHIFIATTFEESKLMTASADSSGKGRGERGDEEKGENPQEQKERQKRQR